MKLPRRKHYTIESAAKRLGVDADEVKYHLSEGTIRYALPNHTSKDDDNHWVKFDQLSDIAKNCVYQCVKIKDWAIHELFKEYGVDRLVRDVALAPEYLYLPNSFPVANVSHIGVMNEGDDDPWGSAIMELLSGEQVIKLAGGYPHYFIIGDKDEQGVYLDAVITDEELAKFDYRAKAEPNLPLDDPERLEGPFDNKVEAEFIKYYTSKLKENKGKTIKQFTEEFGDITNAFTEWVTLNKNGITVEKPN